MTCTENIVRDHYKSKIMILQKKKKKLSLLDLKQTILEEKNVCLK